MLRSFAKSIDVQSHIYKHVPEILRLYAVRKSLETLILECVGGSTMRGITYNCCYTPTSIFQTWACGAFNNWFRVKLLQIKDQPTFDAFHCDAVLDLQWYWRTFDTNGLADCHATKLIDLLIKGLMLWDLPDLDIGLISVRNVLIYCANIPLDKYTLNAIRIIHNARIENCENLIINEKDKMGSVTSISKYKSIQESIRSAVNFPPGFISTSYPPIYFDSVWNIEQRVFHLVKKKKKKKEEEIIK